MQRIGQDPVSRYERHADTFDQVPPTPAPLAFPLAANFPMKTSRFVALSSVLTLAGATLVALAADARVVCPLLGD